MVINRVCLKKVTWAVGTSLLCSHYTSGWTRPWAPPPKKILDPPMHLDNRSIQLSGATLLDRNYHRIKIRCWPFSGLISMISGFDPNCETIDPDRGSHIVTHLPFWSGKLVVARRLFCQRHVTRLRSSWLIILEPCCV